MHYIVVFESDHFDLTGEEPNPINPYHGRSRGPVVGPAGYCTLDLGEGGASLYRFTHLPKAPDPGS